MSRLLMTCLEIICMVLFNDVCVLLSIHRIISSDHFKDLMPFTNLRFSSTFNAPV